MRSSRFGGIVEIKTTAKDNLPLLCLDATIMHLGIKSVSKSDAFAKQPVFEGVQTFPRGVLFGEIETLILLKPRLLCFAISGFLMLLSDSISYSMIKFFVLDGLLS
jgi:hypothetical protein